MDERSEIGKEGGSLGRVKRKEGKRVSVKDVMFYANKKYMTSS